MKTITQKKVKEWQEWTQTEYSDIRNQRTKSPISPDKKTLAFHRKNLKKVQKNFKNPKALILGVTPELRDLALSQGCSVVACDMNLEMIKKMQQFLKIKDRTKEVIIKANWLSVPLKNNSFHIILSDVAINNLPFKDFPKIFSLMSQWLVKGGLLSLREVVHPDDNKFNCFEENLKLFRQGKFSFNNLYLRARFMSFKSQSYNPRTRINNPKKIFEQFKNLYKNKIITKQEFKKFMTLKSNISHTVVKQKEFIKLISKDFKLLDVKAGDSDKYDFYPLKLFASKKK